MPPHVVASKAAAKVRREWRAWTLQRNDARASTYLAESSFQARDLYHYLADFRLTPELLDAGHVRWLSGQYLAHQFDLLGSGWVQVTHGMRCAGLEGHRYDPGTTPAIDPQGRWLQGRINDANLDESVKIWRLVEPEYVPLDWQLDCKSGYRWSERTWYRQIPLVHHGHCPGVDIKVPWELARMQHCSQLALAYGLAKIGVDEFLPADRYLREFRNEVLDFMATNPPRYGVNWACTMDVAIRAANWLLAYDLFRAFGGTFDRAFDGLLGRSLCEHARHIVNNLEWNPDAVGNHYLADIVGLLWLACYVPRTKETDVWLAFAAQEFVREVEHQFLGDGANFEASTSYHGLCAEMVAYGAALIVGLPAEKRQGLTCYDQSLHRVLPPLSPPPMTQFGDQVRGAKSLPSWFWERLRRMGDFIADTTRPDGAVSQIGDRDNGRFVKLFPRLKSPEDESPPKPAGRNEAHGDLRPVAAALRALAEPNSGQGGEVQSTVEYHVVQHLAGVRSSGWSAQRAGASFRSEAEPVPAQYTIPHEADPSEEGGPATFEAGDFRQGVQHTAYPEFGLYVYRSPTLYLAIRCGRGDQNRIGNHAHNDNLSFELAVDGIAIVVDPGTYVYTPAIEQRNLYRSTRMHNTLVVDGREQNEWQPGREGLFFLRDRSRAAVEERSAVRFRGVHHGFGEPHRRDITIGGRCISGVDECSDRSMKRVLFHLAPGFRAVLSDGIAYLHGPRVRTTMELRSTTGTIDIEPYEYSEAYGQRQSAQVVGISTAETRIAWQLQMSDLLP